MALLDALKARWRQGSRTTSIATGVTRLPEKFRGRPTLDRSRCASACDACERACPTGAIALAAPAIDMGRCLFCTDCTAACPSDALRFTRDHRLAAGAREDLVIAEAAPPRLAQPLRGEARRLLGRSLKLRQVSAGGCNACEADTNVLSTIVFDLGRFGIQFVASPRHADGLLVTGPVTQNMRAALMSTYDAVPSPRVVVAVGACAISGGPYAGHPEVVGGLESLLPVDLWVPGCPPHPLTILDGLLRLLGRDPERL